MTNFSTIKMIFSYSDMYYCRYMYIRYISIYICTCMYICKQYYKSVIISRDFQQKKGEDALHNCILTGKLRSHDHHSLLTVSIRILQSNKGADIRFTLFCMQQLNFFSLNANDIRHWLCEQSPNFSKYLTRIIENS